jgi:hypothetical protein
MVIDMLVLGSSAFAGYGDARDGLPTHEDRETFFWTNAYRVEPDAFRDEVPCNYNGFASSEKTPKEPLLYNADLTDAAFYHSNDMRQDGYFDHDSNDGTSWDRRIHRYYSGGMIGENIAYGYSSPYDAVIRGWMCSSGHRANIMNAGYNELGAGVSGTYYTQDFGNRSSAPDRGMALGIHLPHEPGAEVAYYVDWSGGSAPDALYVVADGVRYDLDLELGTDTRGMWGRHAPVGQRLPGVLLRRRARRRRRDLPGERQLRLRQLLVGRPRRGVARLPDPAPRRRAGGGPHHPDGHRHGAPAGSGSGSGPRADRHGRVGRHPAGRRLRAPELGVWLRRGLSGGR